MSPSIAKNGAQPVGDPPALRTVNAWSAGALASAPPSSIVLKGGSGNEASGEIPIQITGIQYNTMGIDFTSSVSSFGGVVTLTLLPVRW
ncbi:hypothetical protein QYZ40_25035 [Vibrio parahaemolyticus]|nr:hypothetical protein [Vibrio parahaemolyticus]MDN4732418.1 hypothetical protein [Vibrio parahaemolyticus]